MVDNLFIDEKIRPEHEEIISMVNECCLITPSIARAKENCMVDWVVKQLVVLLPSCFFGELTGVAPADDHCQRLHSTRNVICLNILCSIVDMHTV